MKEAKEPSLSPTQIATLALTWLAEQGEPMLGFLQETGLTPQDLLAKQDDKILLGFVLEFILQNDNLTKDFCQAQNIESQALHLARMELPGGGETYVST